MSEKEVRRPRTREPYSRMPTRPGRPFNDSAYGKAMLMSRWRMAFVSGEVSFGMKVIRSLRNEACETLKRLIPILLREGWAGGAHKRSLLLSGDQNPLFRERKGL